MQLEKKKNMSSLKISLVLVLCVCVISCASSQSRVEEKQAEDVKDQYERALVAMNYNLVDQAITHLNNAISMAPDYYPSYYLLGVAYTQKMDYRAAAAAFEKCLELKPDNSEARVRLGDVYKRLGLLDKAEEEFKKAYAIDESSMASFNLAVLYYEKKMLDEALDYVRRSIQQDSRSVQAFNLQGVILNERGQHPEAIASFQYALTIEPNNVATAVNLAVAYINNKDYNKATEILQRILPHAQDKELKERINQYLEKIKRLKRR